MYNSQQTSEKRIQELLSGHPTCFYDNFGMAKHVFIKLKNDLIKHSGLIATRHVSVNEQLAIFLTTLWSGKNTWDIRYDFQQSADIISRYVHLIYLFLNQTSYIYRYRTFHQLLDIVISPPFYTQYVKLSSDNNIPTQIWDNPKFYPYFKNCLGAIDGTHIFAHVPQEDVSWYHNWKETIS